MTEPGIVSEEDQQVAPRVAILVVSFNTREMTLECLRSVVRETRDVTYEVLVVDNCSSDGSAEAIAAEFPELRLTRPAENLGFARANNLLAREARSEFLLLLNPDTIVRDRAIDRLVQFADAHPEAGIWGGRTLYGDGSLNPNSCWRHMTLWNTFCRTFGLAALFRSSPLFNPESYGGWNRDTVREVDIVGGCFLLIRHELWRKLDGFHPSYFMYGEEADLCARARRFGARPLFDPDAAIVHYGGASETVRADQVSKLLRAKVTLIRHHWRGIRRRLGEALMWLMPLTRAVAYSLAAVVARRGRMPERAELWRKVWSSRGQWFQGYT
jgi:GT2 family glycosyltransferase